MRSRPTRRPTARLKAASTINTWTAKLADLLRPVNEAIKAEVLDTDALQIDDWNGATKTTNGSPQGTSGGEDQSPGSHLAPGTGKSQTGYWWAYRNIHTSTVYFDWHTSRAMDCL